MGIPKFYRWLSERYPLLNMPVTATEAPPEIDNLYLDMNGIIHNCTHANDPNLKLTETEMVLRIFNYLDKLIQIMKPKKLVFLAIDGVAPRAKMNQQRSRRFKSALERLAHEAEQKAKGDETPDEYKFDSNCITPGTAFMARLGKHLRFFIRKKISEDTTWQQPVVIFSGHDVPGEGEHKIMEYIRWQKRSPHYTPNQRHCMYGLDADLIMLSLVTHEPHFCLLREVVSFSGKNRGQPSRETLENPSAENFILFQIGLLREYIELEFTAHMASKQLSFALDVERVVDDIVLFCMLVGNDFLPALPTLDIAEGALNKLIELYKQLLPQMGGYLTFAGDLNHERLQLLLGVLADAELQTLEERAADTEWFESKRSKRGGGRGGRGGGPSHSNSRPQTASAAGISSSMEQQAGYGSVGDLEELSAAAAAFHRSQDPVVAALATVVPALQGLELEPDEPETGPTMMSKEARAMFLNGGGEAALQAWKERYYKEKLEVRDASPESTRQVVHHYIRGLHWVLQYYYRGVASWDWFYPYHYAPMASDMRNLDGVVVRFNRGKPFKPFEQLLAVLPAASASLLPQPFQWLMTDARSPVLDFYPDKFDIDMEGKRAEWEGIVKVPFIDEQRLLAAAASVPLASLTAEERKRNVPGDMLVYEHAAGQHEPEHCDTTLPHHFGSIPQAHSKCRRVPPPDPIPATDRGFTPALAKGTATGKRNPPGFPTLKTMSNLVVELKGAGVTVFSAPSKKDSLILQLPDVRSTIAADAAAPLLRGMLCGRVYVKWPYLQEAEIVAVSDARQRISVEGISQHSQEAASKWQMVAGQTKNMFLTKNGIDIGPLPIMLDVRVCTGYMRGGDGAVKKEYAKELAPYPLQAVLQSRPKPPPGFTDPDAPKELSLQPGSRVIWVGANYFGCVGTVLADPAAKVAGRAGTAGYVVRVQPVHRELLQTEGRAHHIVQQYGLDFYPSGMACRQLRVNPRMLGRLTGNVWVDDGRGDRVDVGLAVKNAKQGLCVPTLCRPAPEGTGWSYSSQMIELVREYKTRFPTVLAALEPAAAADGGLEGGEQRQKLTAAALFPGTPAELLDQRLAEVRSWLKGLPSSKRPLVSMTSQQASDAAVDRLQMALPGLLPVGAAGVAPVELEQVHPSLLLPPHDPACPLSVLAGGAFEPGDRVVVLRGTGAPPFGARGSVIGVLADSLEVLMDHEYAGGSTLGGRLRGARGAYLPPEQLLNVTRQQPVRGSGPKPRQAAVGNRRNSHDAGAAAADDAVTSPRSAAASSTTRLVALAPWVQGKTLQHASAQAQQQQQDGVSVLLSPVKQTADVSAAAVPPTTQGNRLLQLLKKNQPQVTGPGFGTKAQGAQAQQQQQQQPSQSSAAPQQLPEATRSGSLKAALQAAAAKAQQQQQQAAAAPGPAPSAPDAATGRSLLLRLQKSSSGGKLPPAVEVRQQQQVLQPVQQQVSVPQQPQVTAAAAAAAAPPPREPVEQPQGVQQLPVGSAGANLLAMLQKPPAAAAPAVTQKKPPAEAAATQQPLVQPGAKQLQVKVVPRPKKLQQQVQPQQQPPELPAQQQPAPVPQQQQQQQQVPVQSPAVAQPPKQQQQQQQPPVTPPVDVPVSKVGIVRSRGGVVSDDVCVKPRTPPAGAGAALLANRGQTVIQARLPDGTRGFTMGRGQAVQPTPGQIKTPAAPGSSSSSDGGGGSLGRASVAAALPPPADAAPSPVRAHAAPGLVVNGFAGTKSTAALGAQAAASTDGVGMNSVPPGGGGGGQALMQLLKRGASTDIGSGPQQQQQQPGPAPSQPQQQPAFKPVTGSVAAVQVPGVGAPVADAVAAANTSAASNLLRRLQQQQSSHKQ